MAVMASIIIAYIVWSQVFMADRVSEAVDGTYNVMAYRVMIYTVAAYVVMAYESMTRVVMADGVSEPIDGTYIVMTFRYDYL